MTLPVRTLILTVSVAAALAACQRREDKADAPGAAPAAVTQATAGAPMRFDDKTEYATVKLTLPDAVKGQPDPTDATGDGGVVMDELSFWHEDDN